MHITHGTYHTRHLPRGACGAPTTTTTTTTTRPWLRLLLLLISIRPHAHTSATKRTGSKTRTAPIATVTRVTPTDTQARIPRSAPLAHDRASLDIGIAQSTFGFRRAAGTRAIEVTTRAVPPRALPQVLREQF